jgi:hypothetical protein
MSDQIRSDQIRLFIHVVFKMEIGGRNHPVCYGRNISDRGPKIPVFSHSRYTTVL